MKPLKIIFKESELKKTALKLIEHVRRPAILFLEGEMGAGKSTFARALLNELKFEGDHQGSPTYAIVHEYPSSVGRIAHMDWYRIRDESELEAIGIRDYLSDHYAWVIIEWGSRCLELQQSIFKSSAHAYLASLSIVDASTRSLDLTQPKGA